MAEPQHGPWVHYVSESERMQRMQECLTAIIQKQTGQKELTILDIPGHPIARVDIVEILRDLGVPVHVIHTAILECVEGGVFIASSGNTFVIGDRTIKRFRSMREQAPAKF